MQRLFSKLDRLLGSLESLFEQQLFLFDTGGYTEALELQHRCQPLIEEISTIMEQPGMKQAIHQDLRHRAEALIEKQSVQLQHLSTAKSAVREQLYSISQAISRSSRLRTVYRDGVNAYSTKNYTEIA